MNEQVLAPHVMTETDAQALAWRLHQALPLGWHVETVGHDPQWGWFVELRNDQHPYQVHVFTEEDVARFYELHGPQHPVEFYTESFILTFHPEQVRIELAEAGQVALKDVIELIAWGQQYLPFLKTLADKRVCCPTCSRTDCKLLRIDRTTGLYIWGCWDEHWFTSTYDFEHYVVLPGEPEPEPESDIPF
jgi:hypothetical protein